MKICLSRWCFIVSYGAVCLSKYNLSIIWNELESHNRSATARRLRNMYMPLVSRVAIWLVEQSKAIVSQFVQIAEMCDVICKTFSR